MIKQYTFIDWSSWNGVISYNQISLQNILDILKNVLIIVKRKGNNNHIIGIEYN